MIDRPTLVLNRNWQPVNVATVARALTMLWNDTARVVDPVDYQTYDWHDWMQLRPSEGDLFIQAVRLRLQVPEVVTLTGYDECQSRRSRSAGGTFSSVTITRASTAACSPAARN